MGGKGREGTHCPMGAQSALLQLQGAAFGPSTDIRALRSDKRPIPSASLPRAASRTMSRSAADRGCLVYVDEYRVEAGARRSAGSACKPAQKRPSACEPSQESPSAALGSHIGAGQGQEAVVAPAPRPNRRHWRRRCGDRRRRRRRSSSAALALPSQPQTRPRPAPLPPGARNLPEDIREREIEDLFSKYGKVLAVDMKTPVRPPAFAFVEFNDPR